MHTRNNSSFLFAAKPCSTRAGRLEMTLIVRGTWSLAPDTGLTLLTGLDQGFLSAEVCDEGDDERAGELVYPGDFADVKLNAEVLLRASCHVPRGVAVPECPVKFSVGPWSKTLRVFGPRVWTERGTTQVSEPRPFTTMPLRWQNAFGGPGFAANPVGKGLSGPDVPNVLGPADRLSARSDRLVPAGFGPVNPAWAPRAAKVGRQYDKAWLDARAPYPALDYDWSHQHAAPADQQWDKYLRGDEELAFQNLHPAAAKFGAKLPGERPRVFVHDRARKLREVPMVLDTLFVDLEEARVYLTWRGLDQVRTDDLDDVTSVLVASERLGEARPAEQYESELLEFERDPIGIDRSVPIELQALQEHEKRLLADDLPPRDPALDPLTGELARRLGPLAPAPDPARDALVRDALARDSSGAAERALVAAADAVPPYEDDPPLPMIHKPGHVADPGIRRQMREVYDQITAIRAELADLPPEAREKFDFAHLAALEAIPRDERWRAFDPDYAPPVALSADAPGPGANLSERDFTRQDLSGLDLSGANLSHAVLTRARLVGTRLTGANLRGAVLFRADLSAANLTGADLSRCNAARLRARGANFTEANLDLAFFEDAQLANARFIDSRAEYPYFVRADLAESDFTRARFVAAEFSKCALARAVFARAEVPWARFSECAAPRADFSHATLDGSAFDEATLTGARFVQCRGAKSFWSRAKLEDADFSYSKLAGAMFLRAFAARANFTAADLKDARFDRADLERAVFAMANLLRAELSRARVGHCSFRGANLYEARLHAASGSGADFVDANLTRSTLERWA